jgi:hypothetical protein
VDSESIRLWLDGGGPSLLFSQTKGDAGTRPPNPAHEPRLQFLRRDRFGKRTELLIEFLRRSRLRKKKLGGRIGIAKIAMEIESRNRRVSASLLGLALASYLFSTLAHLVSSECFLDGVVYASISRNLANGEGTFWRLMFIANIPFHEHPPFFFWFESLAFRPGVPDPRAGERIFACRH